MTNTPVTELPRCANCDIDIEWAPTLVGGQTYCCKGCARGGPCSCDYSNLPTQSVVLEDFAATRGNGSTTRYKRR